MLCPLTKGNAGTLTTQETERLKGVSACDGRNCGFWDLIGEQCSLVTIARELRNIRTYGTNVRD